MSKADIITTDGKSITQFTQESKKLTVNRILKYQKSQIIGL